MKSTFTILLLVLSLIFSCCHSVQAKDPSISSKSRQLLVGKWRDIKDRTITYAQDGSYLVEPGGVKGHWQLKGNRVMLTFSDGGTSTLILSYLREDAYGFEYKGGVEDLSRISH